MWDSLLTATNGMWLERQTSKLWGICSRVLSQLAFDNDLAQCSIPFQFYLKPRSSTKFTICKSVSVGYRNIQLFGSQQLQTFCKETVCRIKVFRKNLTKFGQNNFCTPQKLPAPTPLFWSKVDIVCQCNLTKIALKRDWRILVGRCAPFLPGLFILWRKCTLDVIFYSHWD